MILRQETRHATQVPGTSDFEVGKPRMARRSPLVPSTKLCPRCLKPLKKGSQLGGWLVPQDFYCESCGYKGTVFLEQDAQPEGPSGEEKR
ncbi:MAG TPA: hypothetical protein VLY21_03080 [Nitrososphaerales archaeon]|nr:hypothetical protein [Nitrososphaerales archaeon]